MLHANFTQPVNHAHKFAALMSFRRKQHWSLHDNPLQRCGHAKGTPPKRANQRFRFTMSTTKDAARLWYKLNQSAHHIQGAHLLKDGTVTALWRYHDVTFNYKRHYTVSYMQNANAGYRATPPVPCSSCPSSFSPSGTKMLRFFETEGYFEAELWDFTTSAVVAWWSIPADIHGQIYTDDYFCSFAWSPCEQMVAYVADRPEYQFTSFSYLDKTENANNVFKTDEAEEWPLETWSKYSVEASEPFGENFRDRYSPTIFIADLRKRASYQFCGRQTDAVFGEPQWHPKGHLIAATVRPSSDFDPLTSSKNVAVRPYPLGIVHCYNRHAAIAVFNAPSQETVSDMPDAFLEMKIVSDNENDVQDFCCYSPRFSLNGDNLLYLSAPRQHLDRHAGNELPHNGAKVLRAVHINDREVSKPVTVIPVLSNVNHTEFPGIFTGKLPDRPWISDDELVFATMWGSLSRVVLAHLQRDGKGAIQPIPQRPAVSDLTDVLPDELGVSGTKLDVDVLDASEDKILASVSNPVTPWRLLLFQRESKNGSFRTEYISSLSNAGKELGSTLAREVITRDLVATCEEDRPCPSPDRAAREFDPAGDDPLRRFQATLILPRVDDESVLSPLVVYPHGGPHVATKNAFDHGTAAFLRSGKAVLYVNYR